MSILYSNFLKFTQTSTKFQSFTFSLTRGANSNMQDFLLSNQRPGLALQKLCFQSTFNTKLLFLLPKSTSTMYYYFFLDCCLFPIMYTLVVSECNALADSLGIYRFTSTSPKLILTNSGGSLHFDIEKTIQDSQPLTSSEMSLFISGLQKQALECSIVESTPL